MASARPPGVILAGGRSSRMGSEKAFVALDGRPMIAHVIERFAPQVSALAINANGDPARFTDFGLPVLADAVSPEGIVSRGPLAGIAAALGYCVSHGQDIVAIAPVDAPFLPVDHVAVLARALRNADAGVALLCGPRGPEPLASIWHVRSLPHVLAALASKDGSVKSVLGRIRCVEVQWSDSDGRDPFVNVNTPADLAAINVSPSRPDGK